MATTENKSKLFDPQAWGLSPEAIEGLGERMHEYWERFADCFTTQTRDTSYYGLDYFSCMLRMKTDRNFTGIARMSGNSPENIQHFMTNSPWSSQEVTAQIREEIIQTPLFAKGSVLVLDESAEEKTSEETVGASRQYNGRLGKVEMSQVGVFLSLVNDGAWTWVDGELFLAERWFAPGMEEKRARLGLSPDLKFATKIELGERMIERVQGEGLPFEWVVGDAIYGQSGPFRRKLAAAGLVYMLDVKGDVEIYLERPVVGLPARQGEKGKQPSVRRVLSENKAVEVRSVSADPKTTWIQIRVRATERGELNDEFSARRVWTYTQGEDEPIEEWLLMRRSSDGKVQHALSNASAETSLERLAWAKCQRVFVECSIRDAKSDAGWDESYARKYSAWEHHLALTILALWFITQTKLEWREKYHRDPELQKQLEVDLLPALSIANIRELLRAVMPLPQLTPESATQLVVEHFINRTRSRKSRMKARGRQRSPT